ncbi:MAG: Asp-tRNA(Asn)/Glu-tRNA(Gln) amidotransferase subunit GatA [Clostridiales bacterium]|nr:Asp-tRNA(Asn)/Glu-tRNA(Gln) amidotransferase subunit GatA [Clostridiales bacterium]
MELYKRSAAELSALIKSKSCSVEEVIKSTFDRITQVEGKVDAYITICEQDALTKAREVDSKIAKGEKLHPLAGIPIGIKDNISTKGILTSGASKMLSNYIPPYNATVIDKINSIDMIITGKTNLDEFAMGSTTETSYYKPTKNPHNLAKTPGGSSGGSAAAVSAGQAILSLGSDTGGSIRTPAAFCGVVGLKPTYGAVSRFGLIALASSLDQIGPIGRTVTDVAMLYPILCGHDKMDATTKKVEHSDYGKNLSSDIRDITIGIPAEYFNLNLNDEVREATMKAIEKYKELGCNIKEVSLPSNKYALPTYQIISSAEASSNLGRYDGVKFGYRAEDYSNLTEMYVNTRSEGFGDEVKSRILLGTFALSAEGYNDYYHKAKLMQEQISNEFAEVLGECDAILTPTTLGTAFDLGANMSNETDSCTVAVNLAGLPAISLPCGVDRDSMPIGMQIIGKKFDEQTLLNLAFAFEQTSDTVKMPEIV